ncbi:MAG: hypothetical protein JWM10_749 [Myxococcaceae bacterium]|nr:hypothetical protein [Myxococcaceae bacterium]
MDTSSGGWITYGDGDGKMRPHLILGGYLDGKAPIRTGLAIRTRTFAPGKGPPGWEEISASNSGLDFDSVVTLSLNTLDAIKANQRIESPGLSPLLPTIADHVRLVLGLRPKARSEDEDEDDRPRFLQHLPPPSVRRAQNPYFSSIIRGVQNRGWEPSRHGGIYRDHGWHATFNSEQLFLAISVDEFNRRFPLPMAWIVPVLKGPERCNPTWSIRLKSASPPLPGSTPWYADVSGVRSMEASQQWFSICNRCYEPATVRKEKRDSNKDTQCWRVAHSDSKASGRCVRCDHATPEWPIEVGRAHPRDLDAIRNATARYLGVLK